MSEGNSRSSQNEISYVLCRRNCQWREDRRCKGVRSLEGVDTAGRWWRLWWASPAVTQTTVSETIRKPPLAEAQTALGKQKIRSVERGFLTNYQNSQNFRWDMATSQFSRWRISAILNFRGPKWVFGNPTYDFLLVVNRNHSSRLLRFWENRVILYWFWRQTNKQTDEQMDSTNEYSASGGLKSLVSCWLDPPLNCLPASDQTIIL